MATPHVGDIGTIVRLRFTEPDPLAPATPKAVDISSADAIEFLFQKPDDTENAPIVGVSPFSSPPITFTGTGVDGKAEHKVTSSAFWSESGKWLVRGKVGIPQTTDFYFSDRVAIIVKD